jgi:hypothetical protein
MKKVNEINHVSMIHDLSIEVHNYRTWKHHGIRCINNLFVKPIL